MTDSLAALKTLFGRGPLFVGAAAGQTSVVQNLCLAGIVSLAAESKRQIRVLEIGSWTGFTALTWAHSIDKLAGAGGEVICIDPLRPYFSTADTESSGHYSTMEEMLRSGLAFDLFRHNTSKGPSSVPIHHIRETATDALPKLTSGSFDIIYIDGSHYYPDISFDIAEAKRLARQRGFVCGDDLERQLSEIGEAEVRHNLATDYVRRPDGISYHPGVTLAVAEAFSGVAQINEFWSVRRDGETFLPADPRLGKMIVPPHFSDYRKRQANEILPRLLAAQASH